MVCNCQHVVLVALVAKRNSFRSLRSIDDLRRVLKLPCRFHAAMQSVSDASVLQLSVQGGDET